MQQPTQLRWYRSLAAMLIVLPGLICLKPTLAAAQKPRTSIFSLANGMQVVVIPDHRSPVVTHMVWYRVGATDDPPAKSGLAHFLEHLMFKATATIKSGEFTRVVNRLGARHNALTTHDTTTYFQRTAKEHLSRLMELEADRMVNLQLDAQEVLTERDVIKEERRSSVDASPIAILNEQMLAGLYQNHPYGRPVLGWAHEIATLDRDDALAFYKRHYAANNSILVVVGDVTEAGVRELAERTYGRLKPSSGPLNRDHGRPLEPEHIAARRVHLEDARVSSPLLLRYYHAPSLKSASKGEAEALTVLGRILGGDDTSRLYRALVVERRIAVQAGADYQSGNRDSGRLALLALAAKDRTPAELEAAMDDVVSAVVSGGVTDEELTRAKRSLEAQAVFATDNQESRARRMGEALTIGRTLEDVEGEGARIQAVTAADVQTAARTYLQLRRSVTGSLTQPATAKR
ncbi:MAG: M16 family metallopeptidase [Hyphomicrobiaceae bacterium]